MIAERNQVLAKAVAPFHITNTMEALIELIMLSFLFAIINHNLQILQCKTHIIVVLNRTTFLDKGSCRMTSIN